MIGFNSTELRQIADRLDEITAWPSVDDDEIGINGYRLADTDDRPVGSVAITETGRALFHPDRW